MKVKIILLAALCILCVVMAGCNDGQRAKRCNSYDINPNMTLYAEWADGYFYYAVDERSEVVYIIGGVGGWGYMAPAYNADGTLMTKKQLVEMRGLGG